MAIDRADPGLEIAARRLLAQSHSARADFASARAEYERAIELIFKYRSTINNPELQASAADHEQRVYPRLCGSADARRRAAWARQTASSQCIGGKCASHARVGARDQLRCCARSLRSMPIPRPASTSYWRRMAGKRVRMASLADRSEDVDARTGAASARHCEAARGGRRTACDGRARCEGCRGFADGGRTVAGDACRDHATLVCARNGTCIPLGTRRVGNSCDGPGHHARGHRSRPDDTRRCDPETRSAAARRACSRSLSTVLLPAGALRDDAKTLEIVAEGRIAGIPFAGLILPGEPARRLMEGRSIEMIGSLFDARGAAASEAGACTRFPCTGQRGAPRAPTCGRRGSFP